MTKEDLEDEISLLKAQVAGQADRLETMATELIQARNALYSEKNAAQIYKNNADYYRVELGKSSEAWANKYMALQDNADRAVIEATAIALDSLKRQQAAYAVEIERAKTNTLGECFAHVSELLAQRNLPTPH